jgi:hypothetical protein
MIFVPAALIPFSTLRNIRKATSVTNVVSLTLTPKQPSTPNIQDSGHEQGLRNQGYYYR